jgi:hypothetical protein
MIWRSRCVENILLKAPIAFAHGQAPGRIEFTAESSKMEPLLPVFFRSVTAGVENFPER